MFFCLFIVTATIFDTRMRRNPTLRISHQSIPWRNHLMALYVSSGLILVRSLYRLVEYGQGQDGYLLSTEWPLYIFDFLLMLSTMFVFFWMHPSEIAALLRGGPAVRGFKDLPLLHNTALATEQGLESLPSYESTGRKGDVRVTGQ